MKKLIIYLFVFISSIILAVLFFWFFKYRSIDGDSLVSFYEDKSSCGLAFSPPLESFLVTHISSYKERSYEGGEKNIIIYMDLSLYRTSFSYVSNKNFNYSKKDTKKITLGKERILVSECSNE